MHQTVDLVSSYHVDDFVDHTYMDCRKELSSSMCEDIYRGHDLRACVCPSHEGRYVMVGNSSKYAQFGSYCISCT